MATLAEKFDKIKSPKLENQQHTAVVLWAVEDTLRDQKADFSPTAYLAALLALLTQAVSSSHGIVNKDLATSVVYLLDITAPYVPTPLLRSKFSQILASLAPALAVPDVDAPLLRPSIGCLESLLIAQDNASWALPQTQIGPRRAIAGLLSLAVDYRPKVRRRAQEALVTVLKNPPPSPSLDHPAADLCAETALRTLSETISTAARNKKGKHEQYRRQDDHPEPAIIHALQLVKTTASASSGWPSNKIEPLCELLMNISRSSNEYVTMGAFEVFEAVFEELAEDFSSPKLTRLLEAIRELKPAQDDSQLLPPWIAVLSRGYDVSAQTEPQETFEKLPELFELVSSFLASPSRNIRISTSECLISFLVNCVPDGIILEPSIYDEKTLEKLAKSATSLLSVKYQVAWVEVFKVLSAMFDSFKWRSSPYLKDIVKIVGELRSNESFHGKEADQVLGRAAYAMGPAAILDILPLNIAHQKTGQPGRVWLLPILRDNVSNTELGHFRSEFLPLSEALYQRVLESESAEKTVEVKIFETLVQQTWSILPGYCVLPLDLETAFDQSFAELLSNILYKQPELRVDICRALQNLVESNQTILGLESEEDLILQRRISRGAAKRNIAYLSSFANNLLAVLFNVYSQTLPHYRGYILQCINAYLSIVPEKDLNDTFSRVTAMLESALPAEEEAAKQGNLAKGTGDKMPPTSHTLIDLIVTMSIYLPRSGYGSLFSLASVVLDRDSSFDPQLIKKAYKLIPRLAMTETGRTALHERSSELRSLILAITNKTPSPARRDRLLAIHELITYLPTCDLHFIPSVLSEVVLGCKESNEKARSAAFDLLVHMAKRISDPQRNPPGTKIRNHMVLHMPNDSPDAPATLEEFFTMISAGLAGSTPHMVAASVTALSRLFFEFHTFLPSSMLSDLVQAVELFLTSNNREIVKTVLGFVKVAVIGLPEDMLRPRLGSLVPNLMVWSKEHKGRLRAKVKGIFDRLIRRFGSTFLEGLVDEENRKLVVHIRKERERRKRKKKEGHERDGGDDDESEREAKAGRGVFSNEFDRAVYGSDLSSEDSSDDGNEIDIDKERHASSRKQEKPGKRKTSNKKSEQYIRELSPESNPLDLLGPDALASISTIKPSVRFLNTGPGTKKKRSAKFDADGKLIIDDKEAKMDMDMSNDNTEQQAGGNGINAYLAAVTSPSAIRRGQKGRLKFSNKKGKEKDGKNGDGEANDGMDLDGEDVKKSQTSPKSGDQAAHRKGITNRRRGLGVPKARGSAFPSPSSATPSEKASRIEKRRGTATRGRSGKGGIVKVQHRRR